MAPKALSPQLTDDERLELNRLLEKSRLAEGTVPATAADDSGQVKMGMDWSAWKPDGGYASEATGLAYSGPVFTPAGITCNGRPWKRTMKSASMAGPSEPSYSGAMTDACKRRTPDFSDPGDGFEMVDPEAVLMEKLALEEIAEVADQMVPRLPMGHHGSPYQYPVGRSAGLNASIPLPAEWSDTLCELPSVKDLMLSYAELRDKARSGDTAVRGLLNFCCSKFGQSAVEQLRSNGQCKKDGYDLAGWLLRNCWDVSEVNAGSTFRRTSKTAFVRSKGVGKSGKADDGQ